MLAEYGPTLGGPFVGTLTSSKLANLKELSPRQASIRVLFMFALWRSAILLVAGDKVGQWQSWYERAIPQAEQLHVTYLEERAKRRLAFTMLPSNSDARAKDLAVLYLPRRRVPADVYDAVPDLFLERWTGCSLVLVIDLGPDDGYRGGQVVAWETPEEVAREPASRTGAYLAGHLECPPPGR